MSGYKVMKKFVGMYEAQNFRELNKFLAGHARNGDIAIEVRATPWCAAMVNACEREAGNAGTGKLNARSFETYGKPVDLEDAQEGDIVVFKRGSDGWSGHVAYYVSHDDDYITHLGGNQWNERTQQSDQVNIGHTHKNKLLSIRRI